MSDQQDVAEVLAARAAQPQDIAEETRLAGLMVCEALTDAMPTALQETGRLADGASAMLDVWSPAGDQHLGKIAYFGASKAGQPCTVMRIDLGHAIAVVNVTVEARQQ